MRRTVCAFLKDAGLTEPGVDKLVRAAYKMLESQDFFHCRTHGDQGLDN